MDKTGSWHHLSENDVIKVLDSGINGLSVEEAARRREKYGKNLLPRKKIPPVALIFLRQFLSPLIYVLIAAGILSILIGDAKDAIFIFGVIVLNAVIGMVQEWNAEKSAASLYNLLRVAAKTKRDGTVVEIDAVELVPGDIIYLESGSKVPADIRLFQSHALEIDESLLTGESIPVLKTTAALEEETPVSQRSNLALAGSAVVKGRGIGMVVATGSSTEVGKISELVTSTDVNKPPLVIRMERFSNQISYVVVAGCAVVGGILVGRGAEVSEVFFLAVALAVSAIPEGLPVALTVALSVASIRMAKRNVIVRQLTAVESLGSCTVIASDKTGTLTVNQQTARAVILADGKAYRVTGEGYSGEGRIVEEEGMPASTGDSAQLDRLIKSLALCNEGMLQKDQGKWIYNGDAIDVACLALAYKSGSDPEKIVSDVVPYGEIPYESERKYSARFFIEDNRPVVAVKGAVETVIGFCDRSGLGPEPAALDRKKIENLAVSWAKKGYRVLAVASGFTEKADRLDRYEESHIPPLSFLGLIAFIDPLRPEAKEAVATCRKAGVEVVMITGDHPATALSIAQDLGIVDENESVVTGQDIDRAKKEGGKALKQAVACSHVFARVTPQHKLEIVQTMIDLGHFVAVTGDGVNDAPALRKANIGVAMGSGTDIAKETGDMIVTDDNFASIVSGIEEGRFAYDNVRKVIYLLVSTGAAELIIFALSVGSGFDIPLIAVQLLWLNLVTNGIQGIAMAFEGGEPDTMSKPARKPSEGIFNPLMVQQVVLSGAVMAVLAFSSWVFFIRSGMDSIAARNLVLLLMVLLENVHVFNCRSEHTSAFLVPIRRNVMLVAGVLCALGLHVLCMNTPFMQDVLNVSPVSLREFGLMALLSLSLLAVMEIYKLVKFRNGYPKSGLSSFCQAPLSK